MKIKSICIALSAMVILAAFTACKTDAGSSDASLLSFKVGTVSAASMPAAITNADWADDNYEQAFDATKTVFMLFTTADDLVNAPVTWKLSSGAHAEYGAVNTMLNQPDSYKKDAAATFDGGSYVVVKVTSEDGSTVNYYRFGLSVESTSTYISGVTISGETATWGTSGPTYATIPAAGLVSLNSTQAASAEVIVTKGVDVETIRYAKTGGGVNTPVFGDDNVLTSLGDNYYVWLEVTAENGLTIAYYKIQVQMGRLASIASLTIGASQETFILGTPDADWTKVLPPRTEPYNATEATRLPLPFITAVEPDEGFTITATTTSYSSAQYAKVSSLTDPMPASFSSDPIVINNGEILAVKVTSENGNNFAYYKIPLRVPGVTITTQPDTTPLIYHVGDPAATLSVVVDGTYDSIQWVYFSTYGVTAGNRTATTPQGTAISGATGLSYTPDTSAAYSQSAARYVAARVSRAGYADTFSDRVCVNVVPVDQILDCVVDLSGINTKLGPYTGTYQNMTIDLPAGAIPSDFNIMDYSRFTAAVKLFTAHGEEIPIDNDKGNCALMNGASAIKSCYNLGTSATTNNSLLNSTESNTDSMPVTINPTGIRLGTAGCSTTNDNYAVYIQLVELRFTGPGRQ